MKLFLAFCFWIFGIFLVSFFASRYLLFEPQFPYSDIFLIPSKLPQWIWSLANFDGVHYLTIAKQGYSAQFTQAFFPIYPILLRIVSWLIHDNTMILGGLLLSTIYFVCSLFIFSRLLQLDSKYDKKIGKIIFILLLFPTSFYFVALYTESLFFFLVISSFYFARKKKWWIAGILGAVATGTRVTGILLLPSLLIEWYRARLSVHEKKTMSNWRKLSFKKLVYSVKNFLCTLFLSPILYLTPLGLISYMVYLNYVYGDALYFWHAQGVFGANRSGGSFVFPLQVVWRYFKILTTVSFSLPQFWVAFWELSALVLVVGLLLIGHKQKVRFSYLLFSWLIVLIPTLTGTLSSLPRYILLAFPMYIVVGTINRKFIYFAVSICFLVLLIHFIFRFTSGLWVA